jgi:hypothetical protein
MPPSWHAQGHHYYGQPGTSYHAYARGPTSPAAWPRSAPAPGPSTQYFVDASSYVPAYPAAPVAPSSTLYASSSEQRYLAAAQNPEYMPSYFYTSGADTSGAYQYAHTADYEPRTSVPAAYTHASGNSSTSAMPPPSRPFSRPQQPPSQRSVPASERGSARTHGRTKPTVSYSPYAHYTRRPRNNSQTEGAESQGASSSTNTIELSEESPQEIKKKRKRANAHQLKVLNEVYHPLCQSSRLDLIETLLRCSR